MNDPLDPHLIAKMASDQAIQQLAHQLFLRSCDYRYSYNFTWLGRPIIQYPQDMLAIQEIVWRVQPQVIVETGIAHGGSLIFSASLLELMGGDRTVVGIDLEIRSHNKLALAEHPLSHRIRTIEGSSVDERVIKQVQELTSDKSPVLVILDSNHTHAHVLAELFAYAPLVTEDSYIIVLDTVIEDMPDDAFPDRPWGRGNSPKTAVHEFLLAESGFEIDQMVQQKLLLSVAPDGYLRRKARSA
jgi:cephalosporin hydroxylase